MEKHVEKHKTTSERALKTIKAHCGPEVNLPYISKKKFNDLQIIQQSSD